MVSALLLILHVLASLNSSFNPLPGKGDRTDLVPSQDDVYREFNERRRQEGVSKLMSKWVKRNYVFGAEGIPNGESEYLKVIYGFDGESQSALPADEADLLLSRARASDQHIWQDLRRRPRHQHLTV